MAQTAIVTPTGDIVGRVALFDNSGNAIASGSTTGDGAAGGSAATSASYGYAYNSATWDRIRNAAGARVAASPGLNIAVASGAGAVPSLAAATVVAAGVALDNQLARASHSMQITGTGTGLSVNFEVNLDGATWVPVTPTVVPGAGGTVVGSAATTNGLYTVSVPARQIRANLTAITSGAVTATVVSA